MPELPEVETVCRGIRPHLVGRTVTALKATVPALRNKLDMKALRSMCVGRMLVDVRRRGKFIVVECEGQHGLLLHLGMTGAFRICPRHTPGKPHEHVIWDLDDGRQWRFEDARRFGILTPCRLPEPGGWPMGLRDLGPEPLEDEFSAHYLYRITRDRTRPLKNLLLDQNLVAGLGNIYANEALFRARIHPRRQAGRLGKEASARLVQAIKDVLREAIAQGGTTISDFRDVDGSEGRFRIHLEVYGKHGALCPRCHQGTLRRDVLAGRSTFFCPVCQH